jgi:hypothetical protein
LIPLYLIVRQNGEIHLALSKPDALTVANSVLRLEITPSVHAATKIATIGGSAGAYTCTASNLADLSNQHGRSF